MELPLGDCLPAPGAGEPAQGVGSRDYIRRHQMLLWHLWILNYSPSTS